MRYNRYIENAPLISEIGLGAWQLGVNSGWQNMTELEAVEMVHKSLDEGVNFFDTAPNYGNGTSEMRLGKALAGIERDKVVVNTKFGHTDKGAINFNANYIRDSLEGSLRRLQFDYIDSLIIHNPPFQYLDGNKCSHYEILERLKEEGKINAYGASLDTCEAMKLFIETTHGEVIEVFFNILHQDVSSAFDLAHDKGVSLIAKIPLDSGWLSGKYNAQSNFNGVRSRWSRADIETRSRLIQKLKVIVGEDRVLSHIAISFCLSYPVVSTVIPGAVNIDQLKSNLKSLEKPMPSGLLYKLEQFYQKEVKGLQLPW